MIIQGPALRPTAYPGESGQRHRRPNRVEIVPRAHAAGLAGSSAFPAIQGYGGSLIVPTGLVRSVGRPERS